ncbi:MAG: protein phosphatase 2C domain-containing protein [Blastocatellia bacterium]|nr:protein phosphatase 2C domain-containing protein [Blastocatellia bacterium]
MRPQTPAPPSGHHLWRCLAASVCGTSHGQTQTPCQDAHAFQKLANGVLVFAVADGAGSAGLSDIGARLAVATAIERLAAQGTFTADLAALRSLFREAVENVIGRLHTEAQTHEVPVRELATTLIAGVVGPDLAAVLQIGDGGVVVQWEDGSLATFSAPHNTEYVNQTVFVTSRQALETARFSFCEKGLKGIAAFTDGLQMLALKMPEATPHGPFFSPLFTFLKNETGAETSQRQFEAFLTSERMQQRTADDLTLLLAVRNEDKGLGL